MKLTLHRIALAVLTGLICTSYSIAQNPALERRSNSMDFFKSQLLMADPSLISPLSTFNNSGKKVYILNAETRVPIGLGGRGWSFGNNDKYWMNYVELMPEFKVRIFQDDSLWGDESMPVRTPSYLPGLSYMGASKRMWNPDKIEKTFGHYIGVKAYHHSNGQDGEEIIGDTVNLYNGNFGEQVVFQFFWGGMAIRHKEKAGASLNRIQKKNTKARQYELEANTNNDPETNKYKRGSTRWAALAKDNIWYWRGGFEYHPWETWGTNIVFKGYKIYGRHRLQLNGGFIIAPYWKEYGFKKSNQWEELSKSDGMSRKELFRFTANLEYILDKQYFVGDNVNSLSQAGLFNLKKRLNLHLTMYWRIPGTPMAALFVRASYIGSDNYNVYFQKSYAESRVGIALNFWDFDRVVK